MNFKDCKLAQMKALLGITERRVKQHQCQTMCFKKNVTDDL